jgi:hypothetical protein
MIYPTIHLGGTSPQSLLEDLEDNITILRASIDRLSEAFPHHRDYLPLGSATFSQAMEEHIARIERLRSVFLELQDIQENILRQKEDRERS